MHEHNFNQLECFISVNQIEQWHDLLVIIFQKSLSHFLPNYYIITFRQSILFRFFFFYLGLLIIWNWIHAFQSHNGMACWQWTNEHRMSIAKQGERKGREKWSGWEKMENKSKKRAGVFEVKMATILWIVFARFLCVSWFVLSCHSICRFVWYFIRTYLCLSHSIALVE